MKKDNIVHPSGPGDATLERVERAKRELEQMIDMNPMVMLMVGPDGIISRANRALLNLLRLENYGEVLGRAFDALFPCSAKLFPLGPPQGHGGHRTLEIEPRMADGESRFFQLTIVDAGVHTGLSVVMIQETSGLKEQAAHLEKEYKLRAVQALMGALMHNLNQPLTVIMVRARLMLMDLEKAPLDTEEFKKNLEDIMKLTLQISDTLQQAENPKDFITQNYLGSIDILDIERSSGSARET